MSVLRITSQVTAMQYVVHTRVSNLNVRLGPGETFPVVRSLRPGTRVEVRSRHGQWRSLATGGWVHADYLRRPSRAVPFSAAERDQVVAILQDRLLERINFRYGTISVDGFGFNDVAAAIADERIEVVWENLRRSRAEYDFDNDILAIQTGADLDDVITQGVIVHEATHAIQDDQRARMIGSDVEGAAFVAQFYFSLLKIPSLARSRPTDDLAGVALTIARRLYTPPGSYVVSDSEARDLRRKMRGPRLYSARELNAVRVTNGY